MERLSIDFQMLCIPSDRSSRHRQTLRRMRASSASSVAHPIAHRCPHGCILQDPSCSVRKSKNDPLVDQVELRDVNPMYANVRYIDGRESAVSIRDIHLSQWMLQRIRKQIPVKL